MMTVEPKLTEPCGTRENLPYTDKFTLQLLYLCIVLPEKGKMRKPVEQTVTQGKYDETRIYFKAHKDPQ